MHMNKYTFFTSTLSSPDLSLAIRDLLPESSLIRKIYGQKNDFTVSLLKEVAYHFVFMVYFIEIVFDSMGLQTEERPGISINIIPVE